MNDANRPFARQQTLLDDAAPTLEVIATLRLNQPVRFLGMRDGAIDINWMDIHPDRKSLILQQAIEALLSHTLGIDAEAIVTRQHVTFDHEGMGYPSLSICLPSQEDSANRKSVASTAVALLARASFSDVHTTVSNDYGIPPDELSRYQVIAKQVGDKYLSGCGSMQLATTIDIELSRGVVSCGGRILGNLPEVASVAEVKKVTGHILKWNAGNRCFAVKRGNERPEWIFFDSDDDPWRNLRDLLGERIVVQVEATQTLRKLRNGSEKTILTYKNFAVVQAGLFPDGE